MVYPGLLICIQMFTRTQRTWHFGRDHAQEFNIVQRPKMCSNFQNHCPLQHFAKELELHICRPSARKDQTCLNAKIQRTCTRSSHSSLSFSVFDNESVKDGFAQNDHAQVAKIVVPCPGSSCQRETRLVHSAHIW